MTQPLNSIFLGTLSFAPVTLATNLPWPFLLNCPCSSPYSVTLPLGPHLRTSKKFSHSLLFSLVSMLPRVDPQVCTQEHHVDVVNHVSLHLFARHVLVSFCRLRRLVSFVRSAWLHLWFPEFTFPSFQRGHISAKLVTSPGCKALRVSYLCRIGFLSV